MRGLNSNLGVPETGPLEFPERPTQWQYGGLLSWSANQWNSVPLHWDSTATHLQCSNDHKEIAANSSKVLLRQSAKPATFKLDAHTLTPSIQLSRLLCHMWGVFRSLVTAIKTSEAVAQAELPGRENTLPADEYWNVRDHFQPCYIIGFPKWTIFLIQSLLHSKCWIKLYILTPICCEEHHSHLEETSLS